MTAASNPRKAARAPHALGLKKGKKIRLPADECLPAIPHDAMNAAGSLMSMNAQGIIEFVNRRAAEFCGYLETEMIGRPLTDFLTTPDAFSQIMAQIKRNGLWQGELQYNRKNGTTGWEAASLAAAKKTGSAVTQFLKCGQDISTIRAREEALQKSEKKYRRILEEMSEGYFEVDLSGKLTYYNESVCRFYGRPREELVGLHYREHMSEDQAKKVYRVFNEVYRTGLPSKILEYEIRCKDGSVAAAETIVTLMRDDEGRPIGFSGISRDVTDKKRMQTALEQNQAKYGSILSNMEEGYYETDLSGTFIFFNTATCLNLGYAPEEVTGMNYRDFMSPETKEKAFKAFNEVYRTGRPTKIFECEITKKDGSTRIHEMSVSLLRQTSGEPIGFFGISRDRTELMQMEKALRESEQSYRSVVELSPDVITVNLASDGRYLQVNEAFYQQTGYSAEEAVGRTPLDLNLFAKPRDHKRLLKALRAGQVDGLELQFRNKSGTIWDNLVSARTIQFKGMACILFVTTVITPLKKAQKALQESEESYRRILELAPDAIMVLRQHDERYLQVNDAFCQMTGYKTDEMIGKTPLELGLHPDDADRERLFAALRTTERVEGLEVRFESKDGTIMEHLVSAKPIVFRGERCLLLVATDITPLKQAQRALHESEESYRRIMELAPDLIIITRMADGRFVEVNDAFCQRTGYRPDEVIGRTPQELDLYQHPDQRRQWMAKVRTDGKVEGFEIQFRLKDGTITDDLLSARPIHFKGDECLLAVITSVKALKEAQTALRDSEESYRQVLQSAPYSITITRASDSRFIQVNDSFCRRIGYTAEQAIGKTPLELAIYDDPADRQRVLETLHRTGRIEGLQIRHRSKDGRAMENLVSASRIRFKGEDCLLVMTTDITALKKAQQALRESEEKYRSILKNMEEGYYETDLNGNFTFANEAMARIIGYPHEDLPGMNNRQFTTAPNSAKIYAVYHEVFRTGAPAQILDYAVVKKDGSQGVIEASASLLRNTVGEPASFYGICRDVSQRKLVEMELARYREHLEEMVRERTRELEAAQQELIKREKLSVLGQLTATVSHELRNPLGVIRSSNFYLQKKVKAQDPKAEKHFKRIEEQVALCDAIVADLLEYTRGRSVSAVKEDICGWLNDLLDQIQENESVLIRRQMSPNIPSVAYDREKMRRVLINVLDNAIQAVKARAKSGAEEVQNYLPDIWVSAHVENNHLIIEVLDNGIGMAPEVQKRAFEPLFTTRARGTGIGLANVKKIVSEHGGAVTLQSVPGQGTKVTITLPGNFDGG